MTKEKLFANLKGIFPTANILVQEEICTWYKEPQVSVYILTKANNLWENNWSPRFSSVDELAQHISQQISVYLQEEK